MKLAVVGSRGITSDIGRFIALFPEISLIISGGARGVDQLAEEYARLQGIPLQVIRPDYNSFGRAAPLIRDRKIVEEADAVLAIWDGASRGTAYTVSYARKHGKPVRVFRLPPREDE